MSQYQTFPDAPGASLTVEKLKALSLPPLAGKTFLDVGCNEGFFCGYALYDGAERSVGIDNSRHFIERARERFPKGEFLHRGWDTLPGGTFDVILLASALHYADDQAALVHSLAERLTPDGVLVLEIGVFSAHGASWHSVKRDIDERVFPSMDAIREMLKGYAWKWMGPSITQAGDPISRHVFHVSRQRPMAYLLMQPPAYGKTTIARSLFAPAGIPVTSGDEVLMGIARGSLASSGPLQALLAEDFSPFAMDQSVRKVFEQGLAADWLAACLPKDASASFALDAYVPESQHGWVMSWLQRRGYLPVSLSWDRIGGGLPSAQQSGSQAEAYFMSLVSGGERADLPPANLPPEGVGFVDDVCLEDGGLVVRGWFVDGAGKSAQSVYVRLAGEKVETVEFDRQTRPDVQRHLELSHSLVGFVCRVAVPGGTTSLPKPEMLEVRPADGSDRAGIVLPLAGPLVERLRSLADRP